MPDLDKQIKKAGTLPAFFLIQILSGRSDVFVSQVFVWVDIPHIQLQCDIVGLVAIVAPAFHIECLALQSVKVGEVQVVRANGNLAVVSTTIGAYKRWVCVNAFLELLSEFLVGLTYIRQIFFLDGTVLKTLQHLFGPSSLPCAKYLYFVPFTWSSSTLIYDIPCSNALYPFP